jgi:hypothetical protein
MMISVKKGDRLVVHGRPEQAIVVDIVPLPHEGRAAFILDWGPFGLSRVYDHDEGRVWNRYAALN